MGLKTEAKKGTVIEVGGVRIEVLRGSPRLEISAPPEMEISVDPPESEIVPNTQAAQK